MTETDVPAAPAPWHLRGNAWITALFPDISRGSPLFSVFLSRFRMTFPAAHIIGDPA